MNQVSLVCSGCRASYRAPQDKYEARTRAVPCPACGEPLALKRPAEQNPYATAESQNPYAATESQNRSAKRPLVSTGAIIAAAVVASAGLTAWLVLLTLAPPPEISSPLPDVDAERSHFAEEPTDHSDVDALLAETQEPPAGRPRRRQAADPTERARPPRKAAKPQPAEPGVVPAPAAEEVEVLAEDGDSLRYHWRQGQRATYQYGLYGDPTQEVTLGGICQLTVGPTWKQIIERKLSDEAAQDEAQVELEDATGSAFVASADGYLLTCAHVVDDAEQIIVELGGKRYAARVLVLDPQNDLALMRINATGLTPLAIAEADAVRLSEGVRVVGFPLLDNRSSRMSVTRGTVSSLLGEEEGASVQIDAPINPGNSGGPVVNDRGQVVGVASSRVLTYGVTDVGFAAPTSRVRALLARRGVTPVADALPPGVAGPDLVESVAEGVGLVRVKVRPDASKGMAMNYWCRHDGSAVPSDGIGWSASSVEESGEFTCRSFGMMLGMDSKVVLPFLWAHPLELIVEDLDPKGRDQWSYHWSHDIKVEPPSTRGLQTVVLTPQHSDVFGRMPGGFARPRYARPFGSHFDQQDQPTEYSASSETECRVTRRTDDAVTVLKTIRTNAQTQSGDPAFSLNGRAALIFNAQDGLLDEAAVELSCDWKRVEPTKTFPVRFACKRYVIDGQAREAAIVAEVQRLTAQAEQKREVAARLQTSPDAMLGECLDAIEANLRNDQSVSKQLKELTGYRASDRHRTQVLRVASLCAKKLSGNDLTDVAEVLGAWGDERQIPLLVELMGRVPSHRQHTVIDALGNIGGPGIVKPLVDVLKTTDSAFDRAMIERALREVGAVAEASVLPLLDHDDDDVRETACDILGVVGTRASLGRLREFASATSDTFERHRAEAAVRDIQRRLDGGSTPHFHHFGHESRNLQNHPLQIAERTRKSIATLGDPATRPGERMQAVNQLGDGPVIENLRAQAMTHLMPLLEEYASDARLLGVIRAVGVWGSEEHAAPLNDLLRRTKTRQARLTLFAALAQMGDQQSSRLLAPFLVDEQYSIEVRTAFRKLDPQVEQRLISWLRSKNLRRRALAAEVLGRAGGREAHAAITAALADEPDTIALDPMLNAAAQLRFRGVQ